MKLDTLRHVNWRFVAERLRTIDTYAWCVTFFVFTSLSLFTITDMSALVPSGADDLTMHPITRYWADHTPIWVRIAFVYAPIVLWYLYWFDDVSLPSDAEGEPKEAKNPALTIIYSTSLPIIALLASKHYDLLPLALVFLFLAVNFMCGVIVVLAMDGGDRLRDLWDRRRAKGKA